ncbi:MAG: hypothetical protein AMS24_05100 [Chlamydiae bacterium SM23_39]|nr:MAG: hypothetical protein AMS24_05100 [Chlamydiae bacterium SM23_39]
MWNNDQKKAIKHMEGPLLIVAGAGSGKTKVVTNRIAHLIDEGIPSTDILGLTFTNKAAKEMRDRVEELTKEDVFISTFHSLGAKILRESIYKIEYKTNFSIFDEEDSLRLLKSCFRSLKKEEKYLKYVKAKISQSKNNLISYENINKDSLISKKDFIFLEIYPFYQKKLKECNAVDFDDLLFLTALLLEKKELRETYQKRWSFILIDEYQDTNFSQYTMAKILSEKHKNIFVVGDPDQSIYSWRGARYENILEFDKDFKNCSIIKLEQNYRSSQNILLASNSLIEHNQNRYKKNLFSYLDEGEKVKIFIAEDEKLECDFVIKKILEQDKERAIFYRTNAQSRIFEDILIKKKIPYIIYGSISFYQRKEIKDILAFLNLIISDDDFISFSRTINLPKRGIGKTTLLKFLELKEKNNLSLFSLCQKILKEKNLIKITKKQKESFSEYLSLIFRLRDFYEKNKHIDEIILYFLKNSDYLDYLKEDPDTYEERKENIDELIKKAATFEGDLYKFFEEITLLTTNEVSEKKYSLKLMTIHNSKGLEFDEVFIVGMDEGLFPHENCKDEIEEERRLCYVGMTRAKKKLYLTCSLKRFLHGKERIARPSRFLKEISKKYVENLSEREIRNSFYVEDRVFHKTFGIGVVKRVYNTFYGDTYDVFFEEENQIRSLIAKYAKLEKY